MLTIHTIVLVAFTTVCHTRALEQGSGMVTICEPATEVQLSPEEAVLDMSASDDPEDAEYVYQTESCQAGDPLCTDLYGSVSFVGGGK